MAIKFVGLNTLEALIQKIITLLDKKVDKVSGKGLSTNDFTNSYVEKLDSCETGAQVNIIETVTVNNKAQKVTNKALSIEVDELPDGLRTGYVTSGQRSGSSLGKNATCEGTDTTASNANAHSEGINSIASGNASHAEGGGTTASSQYAHAEGYLTTAEGNMSHAAGHSSVASGDYANASGYQSQAAGIASMSAGYETAARGNYSFAAGRGSWAEGEAQTVLGRYNQTKSDCAFVIGNGTVTIDSRGQAVYTYSNAFEVDWDGNITCGDINGVDFTKIKDGEDGFTPTISVATVTGGHNITITNKDAANTVVFVPNGVDGAKGADGARGDDGYTPVKGVDYFTAADIDEIVKEVLSRIPIGDSVSY